MIDLQLLRNPEFVEQLQNAAKSKRMDFDAYLLAATFDERRLVVGQLDSMRARQKAFSARFRDADAETRAALSDEMNDYSAELKVLRARLQDVEARLEDLALRAPNIPDPLAPVGSSEDDNEVIRHVGEPRAMGEDMVDTSNWRSGWAWSTSSGRRSSPGVVATR